MVVCISKVNKSCTTINLQLETQLIVFVNYLYRKQSVFSMLHRIYVSAGLADQHLVVRPAYSYSIALIVLIVFMLKTLIKPICKVKILVRPWPDLPGWFLSHVCLYI